MLAGNHWGQKGHVPLRTCWCATNKIESVIQLKSLQSLFMLHSGIDHGLCQIVNARFGGFALQRLHHFKCLFQLVIGDLIISGMSLHYCKCSCIDPKQKSRSQMQHMPQRQHMPRKLHMPHMPQCSYMCAHATYATYPSKIRHMPHMPNRTQIAHCAHATNPTRLCDTRHTCHMCHTGPTCHIRDICHMCM